MTMKIKFDKEWLKMHYEMLKLFGAIDDNQKIIILKHELEKDPYKRMCLSIAEGYDIDWNGYIISNEFGEMENYDSFIKRHPTFADDVKKAVEEVVYDANKVVIRLQGRTC